MALLEGVVEGEGGGAGEVEEGTGGEVDGEGHEVDGEHEEAAGGGEGGAGALVEPRGKGARGLGEGKMG